MQALATLRSQNDTGIQNLQFAVVICLSLVSSRICKMVFMLHIRSSYSPNPLSILRFPVDCNSSKLSFMLFKGYILHLKVLCTCHFTAARAGGPALKAEVKSSKMACTCTFNEVWSENTVKMGLDFGLVNVHMI
jgi:hypothetical protein